MSAHRVESPHGTVARYWNSEKCRCKRCKAAYAAYMREHRKKRPAVVITDLLVECWCRSECVWVPRQDVKNGLTKSCGRSFCGPEGDK